MIKLIHRLLNFRRKSSTGDTSGNFPKHIPDIISRSEHRISRKHISHSALKVLYRLHKAGYQAYLVGGSVRDLLLGLHPKDFDIVTDAHPEQVKKLFRNSFIIGRRFRLVHVQFGSETIEVATFRKSEDTGEGDRVRSEHGMLLRDNVYGTLEDDVWRRDFTVNALYYNIGDFSVVDYAKGMQDLKNRKITVIGEPITRYHEDPARMLRAIRFAAKLDFEIEEKSAKPIREYKHLILNVPPARLFDKMLKIFHSGKAFAIFQLLLQFDLFGLLFPQSQPCFEHIAHYQLFLEHAFHNTDKRINDGKNINAGFLFAVILWGPVCLLKEKLKEERNLHDYSALMTAAAEVIQQQLQVIAIPRRYTTIIREIWVLQYFFQHNRRRSIYRIFHHPRFRTAYDFLVLRAKSHGDELQELATWWEKFQEVDDKMRDKMIKQKFSKPKIQRNDSSQ